MQNKRERYEKQFVAMFDKFETSVYKLAFYLLGDKDEAKDVTQDVFMKAWRVFPNLRMGTVKSWLLKTTNNLCIDLLRRRKFQSNKDVKEDEFLWEIPDISSNPEDKCLNKEMQKLVRNAVDKLPPSFRSAIVLREFEGLSYTEISEILDLPLGTVKSNIYRGRRTLKELLRPIFQE